LAVAEVEIGGTMKKKLSIHRETVRTLTSGEMQGVVGGFAWSEFTNCTPAYSVCETCHQCDSVTGWSAHSCYELPV
jgi:hypothetical protein